ncbi:MAG: hypothetical protein ACRDPR_17560 [Nocardioidaceae bacterium]
MVGTSTVAVKQALLAALQTALTGSGVQTAYSWPGGTEERELVYLGNAQFAQELHGFRGGGRVPRKEDVTAAVHVVVTKLGATSFEEAEERAAEIGAELENALAGNPSQTGQALLFTVNGGELGSYAEDEFTTAVLSYQVTAESILT